jgi:hypothetical protein
MVAEIRLFAQFGAPTYLVVVGVAPGLPANLPVLPAPTEALHNFYRVMAKVD